MTSRIAALVFLMATVSAGVGCTGGDGKDGAIGPVGPVGEEGPQGDEGMPGEPGEDGEDGEDGQDGANGVTSIALSLLGRYETGIFDQGASEIVSYDAATRRVFFANAAAGRVEVLDIADPTAPTLVSSVDVTALVAEHTGISTALESVNSVAVHGGVVAVTIAAASKEQRGVIAFLRATDAMFLAAYEVGFLPDCVAFSPDGSFAVVANEGEPLDDYSVDPIGSITVVDVSAGVDRAVVTDLDFTAFDAGGPRADELDPRVRVFGVKASGAPSTVAEDLEPEYVAFAEDSTAAYVSLQEANAIAVIDLGGPAPAIDRIFSVGFKDHSRVGNELDVSDRDDGIDLRSWPVLGMPMPDTIATYSFGGETMIVTANEGDTRDYDGFSEEVRVKDLDLDPERFPDAEALQADANLGRLVVTAANGDDDGDGDYDRLFSFGGRSFSIFTADGDPLFDSGSQFELVTSFRLQDHFNSDNADNEVDTRSDAKGPEPEALALGRIGGATFAFIGLERSSGIMVYNVSNPQSPRFVEYAIDRDFAEEPSFDGLESNPAAGDLGPESIRFVPASDSPDAHDLLIVGNEVSGTTSIYRIDVVPE